MFVRAVTAPRYRWAALLTVLAGLFASGITITILGNSLPLIAKDLHTDDATATWILTAQLLTLAVLMPLMGKLGDTRGHRKVYLAGFAIFTLMAIPTAIAPNIITLLIFRVIGAAGGAATNPTSMAIIMHSFRDDDRVKAIGWWQLVGAGAPVIGLAAGGPIVETVGWRWIFVGQGVISIAALIVGTKVLRETPVKSAGKFDIAGSSTLAVGVICLLLGMQLLRQFGVSVIAIALLLIAPVVLTWFVRIERNAAEPLLPLRFFAARNFTASLVAQFGANFAYMGSLYFAAVGAKPFRVFGQWERGGHGVAAAHVQYRCTDRRVSRGAMGCPLDEHHGNIAHCAWDDCLCRRCTAPRGWVCICRAGSGGHRYGDGIAQFDLGGRQHRQRR